MIIDYTITLGNIFEVVSIAGGGLLVLIRMNNNVVSLQTSVGDLKGDITGMQQEITKLGEVLIKMAVTDTRLAAADDRIANLEKDIRELRHGDGFIKGQRGIDKEYL